MARHRTLIAATSIALAASGLLAASAPAAYAADSAKTTKSFTYKCKIKAGGLSINPADVKVTVRARLPGSVEAGSTIGKRRLRVTLRMPEVIRDNAVNILRARTARGSAQRAHVVVKIGKERSQVRVKRLRAQERRIPRRGTWRIKATGTMAAVQVPKGASGAARILVPKRLRVKAKLFRRNGSKIRATMACKAPKRRAFETITITG